MYPSVPAPKGLISRPVSFKLRPGWSYDATGNRFVSGKGSVFTPGPLPKKSLIVPSVPSLAGATSLSKAEQRLSRYMQVVLPPSHAPEDVLTIVLSWPCVEEAFAAPEVSLPGGSPSTAHRRTR